METVTEQRTAVRTELCWPVSVWSPQANQFFNGRSSNISNSGVFFKVPATAPLSEGNIVELNFPRTTSLAQQKGQFARIKSGRVVRVEDDRRADEGNIGVAVQFE